MLAIRTSRTAQPLLTNLRGSSQVFSRPSRHIPALTSSGRAHRKQAQRKEASLVPFCVLVLHLHRQENAQCMIYALRITLCHGFNTCWPYIEVLQNHLICGAVCRKLCAQSRPSPSLSHGNPWQSTDHSAHSWDPKWPQGGLSSTSHGQPDS